MPNKEKEQPTENNGCIIHFSSTTETDLIKLKTLESFKSLYDAAKIRDYKPITDIIIPGLAIEKYSTDDHGDGMEDNKEITLPDIFYHRRFRSLFTMKKTIDNLKRSTIDDDTTSNHENSNDNPNKRPSSSRRPGINTSNTLFKIECIFCQKDKFKKYPTKSRVKLHKVETLDVDNKIRKAAEIRDDSKIISIASRDLVAAEAYYHFNCYRNFIQPILSEQDKNDETEDSTQEMDNTYDIHFNDAVDELSKYIQEHVIEAKETLLMSNLYDHLNQYLKKFGYDLLPYNKKSLKCILEERFLDQIQIFSGKNNRLFITSGSRDTFELIEENFNLKKEIEYLKAQKDPDKTVIKKAAVIIRDEIKSNNNAEMPWPFHPNNTDGKYITIPNLLVLFLTDLLMQETKAVSKKRELIISSIVQDFIYIVSNGKQRPPKQYLLAYAIKTLTGNVELIAHLHRLGHCLSYSHIQENETALCLQKLAASEDGIILPSTVKPGIFTNLAWDNIDRNEETLSGKGTTHRVNGIAVQNIATEWTYADNNSVLPAVPKVKKRTVPDDNTSLKVYLSGNRTGPAPIDESLMDNDTITAQISSSKKDLAWCLFRLKNTLDQSVPSWTGFNILISSNAVCNEDTVSYLPTINASPTDMSTVHEILCQSELIRKKLNLNSIVVTMDQALYAKAAEILWKKKSEFSNIILRLGTFHTICNLLSIIGKRFGDAGLKDLLIESGVLAEGSVAPVLSGKAYNRAVRVHKCLYEALIRIMWQKFLNWIDENHPNLNVTLNDLTDFLGIHIETLSMETIETLLKKDSFIEIHQKWCEFCQFLKNANGELSNFWMSYIEIVEGILLNMIRASREGNWNLHLFAIHEMIPWCFAYDKINYARYLPAYYSDMLSLENKHPDVYEAFVQGNFSVQLSKNCFSKIPVDQSIEMTINKDTQTPGGTTKFSLRSSAVKRYYMTAEHRRTFLCKLRNLGNITQQSKHKDLLGTRMKCDEKDVSRLSEILMEWCNPFENNALLKISTGRTIPNEMKSGILNAKDLGKSSFSKFVIDRLSENKTIEFHAPMKRLNLKTFTDLCKKKEVKLVGRSAILKADRNLFARMIIIAQQRNVVLSDVLAHPLGPMPWALSTNDGTLRKTNKAALLHILEKNVPLAENISYNSAILFDGMAVLQKISVSNDETFGDLALSVFKYILNQSSGCHRIDMVFDTYKELSIKTFERLLRNEKFDQYRLNETILPGQK